MYTTCHVYIHIFCGGVISIPLLSLLLTEGIIKGLTVQMDLRKQVQKRHEALFKNLSDYKKHDWKVQPVFYPLVLGKIFRKPSEHFFAKR